MMLYCNIGAQAFSKEGFKGLESVYLPGQALQSLLTVPAPIYNNIWVMLALVGRKECGAKLLSCH
jgi:hypothetical protein